MRVLLDVSAVPPRPVGVGMYALALARGLDAHTEIDLHLLTRRDDGDRWNELAKGVVVHAVAPTPRPLRLVWEQLAAPALARRIAPDVWHGPHYTMPLRVETPAVVTIHDMTFFDHPEWHERTKVAYFRRMIRATASRAAVLICDSSFTERRLQQLLRPRCEVIVAPLGVDATRFSPDAANVDADLALLASHGISPPYVAFAGTLEPRKNIPALVRAFSRIAADRPELRLAIAGGDGWGVAGLRDAISESGVASRILRPGYLDDATLAALFRRAAVVAYPSFEEGFGLPALEAMASGTPLVTTLGSALEEVVGDAGLLVAPDDADALARAIASVLDDEVLASRLRAAGPARAAEFTWKRTVDGSISAYRDALRVHAPA